MLTYKRRTKPHLARLFVARPNIIDTWFGQKGYTGELFDKMLTYFQTKSGISGGTLDDHIVATLTGLGYSGTLQDQLSAFFDAQVGSLGTRVDNEIAFWQNFTLDFSNGAVVPTYLLLETGDFILLETGDKFLLER